MSTDYLECPCCGDAGAEGELFTDGQPLLCGCPGQVSCDEYVAYINAGDEPCVPCELRERLDITRESWGRFLGHRGECWDWRTEDGALGAGCAEVRRISRALNPKPEED